MRTAVVILLLSLGACGFGDDGKLQALIDAPMADAPVDAMVDAPPPPMERVFEATPRQQIPDPPAPGAAMGISIPFQVTMVTFVTRLEITVDVSHTFRGDISIDLLRGGALVKPLKLADTSDVADDIKATYTVTPTELGSPLSSSYAVRFIDHTTRDVGTVNSVRMVFKVSP